MTSIIFTQTICLLHQKKKKKNLLIQMMIYDEVM